MKKIRLSYTLISTFLRNADKNKVIECYLRMDNYETVDMKRGKDFDLYTEAEVKKTNALPKELGSIKLNKPVPKLQVTVSYNNLFDIKIETDFWDDPDIIEIKNSRVRDSADFVTDLQLSLYFLVLELAGYHPKRARLYRYNPIYKDYDMAIVYRSQRRIDEARRKVEEAGPKIYKLLQEAGII